VTVTFKVTVTLRRTMGLDIFFIEDIRNALVAANEASMAMARVCAAGGGDLAVLRAYLEGYRAALTTVALAFGLEPAIIAGHQGEVLEVETRVAEEANALMVQEA